MVKFVGFLGFSGLVFSNPLISDNDFIAREATAYFKQLSRSNRHGADQCRITAPSWAIDYIGDCCANWAVDYNCEYVDSNDDSVCVIETSHHFQLSLNVGYWCTEVEYGQGPGATTTTAAPSSTTTTTQASSTTTTTTGSTAATTQGTTQGTTISPACLWNEEATCENESIDKFRCLHLGRHNQLRYLHEDTLRLFLGEDVESAAQTWADHLADTDSLDGMKNISKMKHRKKSCFYLFFHFVFNRTRIVC